MSDYDPSAWIGQITDLVRDMAEARDVSERTGWRLYARMREGHELPAQARACDYCGKPLPANRTIRRRFCDATCRVSSHRTTTRART